MIKKSVLIVDDNEKVLESLSDTLSSRGYKVYTERTTKGAFVRLHRLETCEIKIAMIALHKNLNPHRGIHLLDFVKAKYPNLDVIMLDEIMPSYRKPPISTEKEKELYMTKEEFIKYKRTQKMLDIKKQGQELRMKRIADRVDNPEAQAFSDYKRRQSALAEQKVSELMAEIFDAADRKTRKTLWRRLKIKAKIWQHHVSPWRLKRQWKIHKRGEQ